MFQCIYWSFSAPSPHCGPVINIDASLIVQSCNKVEPQPLKGTTSKKRTSSQWRKNWRVPRCPLFGGSTIANSPFIAAVLQKPVTWPTFSHRSLPSVPFKVFPITSPCHLSMRVVKMRGWWYPHKLVASVMMAWRGRVRYWPTWAWMTAKLTVLRSPCLLMVEHQGWSKKTALLPVCIRILQSSDHL